MAEAVDVEGLAADLESDRVERKESASSADEIRRAICAFANDLPGHGAPGYILVGVNDKGRPISLAITDNLLKTLADARSDGNTLPPPRLSVRKASVRGVPIALVEVQPSDSPPVRFKGQVWVRVGPRRGLATAEEERRLAERTIAGTRTFDVRPCVDATLDDLILASFQADYLPRAVDAAVLAENRRPVEDQLASLRFCDPRRRVPTNAGVLLLGQDPLVWLPGAYVQFVRYAGVTLADPVSSQMAITGTLLTQLRQLDQLLPIQIQTARVPAEGLRHEDKPDFPIAAVRELVLNAVMHRTYEGTSTPVRINWFADRVEILSPGGLYGQVTPENFERVSDYRNPVVAEAMKVLGYVEKFGAGIARAQAALRSNANPSPAFEFHPTHVLVTIRRPR